MEKKEVLEDIRPVSISSDHEGQRQHVKEDPNWHPGFRARFPWLGFCALLAVFICLVLSVVILVKANHTSQTAWFSQAHPNVLISIINAIASVCFTIAIGNGIAIAWWRRILKGTSIADLDRSYKFGTNIKEVVFSLKYFNVLALGALAAKLTVIDGVLMQRAFNTYTATDLHPITVTNVTGFANKTFPITGTVVGTQQQPGLMMHWMGDTLKMWSQNGGIYKNEWSGCEGLCYLNVSGIGFEFDCSEKTETPINYGKTLADSDENGSSTANVTLFSIDFDVAYIDTPGKTSYLTMNVNYTDASQVDGNVKSCPVVIANTNAESSVSLGENRPYPNGTANYGDLHPFDRDLKQQKGFDVIQPLHILESHNSASDNINSTLSGIQLAMMMYIKGHSTLTWNTWNTSSGTKQTSYIIQQMGHSANYMTDPPTDPNSCAFAYTDPLKSYHAPNGLFTVPSVIAKINQIMFGLSTDISEDDQSNDHTRVSPAYHQHNATEYRITIHYQTEFGYVFGAVAATLCCILLVLPLYWGFWEIGRKVSLNPFEIAYAFRSPIVAQASTAVTADLIQQVGNRQIRYGPIVAGDGRGRFGVAEPQNVAEPPGQGGLRTSWRSERASWRST